MRTLVFLLALSSIPSTAAALPPDRALTVQAGVATPLEGGGTAAAAVAVGAAIWLEGPLEATASLGWTAAPRTAGRTAAPSALAGLRIATGGRVRAWAWVEAGLERGPSGRAGGSGGLGVGLGIRRGAVTAALRGGVRTGTAGGRAELGLALEAGF